MEEMTLSSEYKLAKQKSLVKYYEKAGADYGHWSPNYNMHFGYATSFLSWFKLEGMLEEMNNQILKRVASPNKKLKLLDMGCGTGAFLRYAKKSNIDIEAEGVTVVEWQIEKAKILDLRAGSTTEIKLQDYSSTEMEDNSYNAITAMESACYADGVSKKKFLTEVYRLLEPGGKVAIGDGFRKQEHFSNSITKSAYRKLCDCWVINDLALLPEFIATMKAIGFRDIRVEDISWRVAPSVAYTPLKVISFLTKELFSSGLRKMNKERWNNLISPLLTMVLGLDRKTFSYCIVSAKK
jgi:ubiquinone/menaquinone biosynthesis C-methylase UbiE